MDHDEYLESIRYAARQEFWAKLADQEREDRERYWNSAEGRAESARQEQQRIDQEEYSKRRAIERVVEEALDRKQKEQDKVNAKAAAEAQRISDEAEAKKKAMELAAQVARIPQALTDKDIATFGKMWMPMAVATLRTWQKYRPDMVGLKEVWVVVHDVLDHKHGCGGDRRKTVMKAAAEVTFGQRTVIETGKLVAIAAVAKELKAKHCSKCHGLGWYYEWNTEKDCRSCWCSGNKSKVVTK
jgi:flagellar biosynthesis GTPase FlhF